MLNIIERLDSGRFQPAVCVMRKGGDLDGEVQRLGIPFLEAPFSVPALPYSTLMLRAWEAARAFRSYRFVLWHSFHYSDDYTEALIARLAGCRTWVYTKKNMNWNRRAWYVRTLLASRVVAQNTDMKRDFFRQGPFDHSCLIPRGVDAERFYPGGDRGLRIREQLGLAADTVVAGCAAHLVPVKGHATLLRAAVSAAGVHILLAGKPLDQEYVTSLQSMARELGVRDRLHFLGGVQDVPAFLAELDIFILPTWAKWRMEGCPVALLEAMASGLACIATDIPGARDIIENGVSGILVPPEDETALARAIDELAASPQLRRQLGEAARRRILTHYTIEREVEQHEALYASLLGSH